MSESPSLPDRRLVLLLPSAFLSSLAIGIINLGMLFVIKESYDARPAEVGWFAALCSMTYFAGCILFRPLSRILKASTSMAVMNLAAAAFFILHLLTPSLASAFIANGLYGLATALFWPRLMGWLTSGLEGQALSRASGAFSFSWSSGAAIAPYLAGLLAERRLFLPIHTAIALFIITGAFIIAARRLAPSPVISAVGKDVRVKDSSTSLRYPAWIGVFLVYSFLAVFFNIFPLFAKDELGLTESGIGLILLARAASTAFGFWLFSRLHYWHFRPLLIPLGVLVLLLLDLLFIFIRTPLGFGLGLILAGLVQADLYGKSIFYGASGASDRDRRVTIHEALLTVGQILGSVAGGLVYQLFSWPLIFLGLALLMAAGLGLQMIFLRRGRWAS